MEIFTIFIKPTLAFLGFLVALYINSWIFDHIKIFASKERANLWKSIVRVFLIFFGALIFVFALPISTELKSQIFSLFGIILSAGIALSSTTLLGNLLAGIMNNSEGRFESGDLIEVDNFQGRVTKKSFFYTEIQLEDSNFITIPNLFLATKAVKNTRKKDTIIATEISLGYDVPHDIIEEALKQAALQAKLTKPYVYIKALGDFSVVYKIHGFLDDSDKYFSSFHILNKKVLDVLHEKNIEIVSPTFMNQRQVNDKEFIPPKTKKQSELVDSSHEEQIFDKANSFKEIEEHKKKLEAKLQDVEDKEQKGKIKAEVEKLENKKEELEEKINNE